MLHTRGFKTPLHLADHFLLHGFRLGVATEIDYLELADQLFDPRASGRVRQFVRPWNRDVVRYDEAADIFGVLDRHGYIKTCYRPDPGVHREPSNLDYYLSELDETL